MPDPKPTPAPSPTEATETYYPTTTIDASPATLPREGEGVASHYAYEAEHQRASAWREEALRCQAKLVKQDKMIRIRDDEISGRKSWLARIEAAAKDVFALRYMACLTLDTAIYRLWLATEGAPSIYPAVVVPTASAASCEAENASLHAELAKRDETIRQQEDSNENLWRDMNRVQARRGEAVALVAERDEMVAFLKEQNACLEERLESRIMMTKGLETELREANAKNAALLKQNEFLHGSLADQEKEITSLRTQLARVEEIKEAARKARDWLATMGAATPYGVIRWLTEALDAPSTSPRVTAEACSHCELKALSMPSLPRFCLNSASGRTLDQAVHEASEASKLYPHSIYFVFDGTAYMMGPHQSPESIARGWTIAREFEAKQANETAAEGARLAILERLAVNARTYVDGTGDDASAYYLLVRVLDELEAAQCPSR